MVIGLQIQGNKLSIEGSFDSESQRFIMTGFEHLSGNLLGLLLNYQRVMDFIEDVEEKATQVYLTK